MGGVSKEREISLRTGTAISVALKGMGYNVIDIDVGLDVVDQIKKAAIDVAFIALHGKYGEDGTIQALLELLNIPYTGSGVLASAVAMDKVICNRLVHDLVVDAREAKIPEIPFSYPIVVKPSREGSTIGMSIVKDKTGLRPALELAAKSDWKVILEEYVNGREVTVGIIDGDPLPTIEIAPKSGFYDYQSKYTKGATEYIVPARISKHCEEMLMDWTKKVFDGLTCSGCARADYIVRDDESAVFLEINTIPGMTETSLVPKAAKFKGIEFSELVERMLDGASFKG